MKRFHVITVLCILVTSILPTISRSELIGVLPATPGGTDYQAYYDTEADITWLADANAGAGSPYDDDGGPNDGRMNWDNANAWIASLNINGVTGWRLPYTPNDPTCESVDGLQYYNCSDSEFSNLFYNVLGGVHNESIATTHNANYELFSNIDTVHTPGVYWSTERKLNIPVGHFAWMFIFKTGALETACTACAEGDRFAYVWAVHSGNAGEILVPTVDIRPGSAKNPINPRSSGIVQVAVLTTDTFDASQVDIATVKFGPGGAQPVRYALDKVNGDTLWDLKLHFRTRDTGIVCGDTEATVTGQTVEGLPFSATDTIKTVGCK